MEKLSPGLDPASPEWWFVQDVLATLRSLDQKLPNLESGRWFCSLSEKELLEVIKKNHPLSPKERMRRCTIAATLLIHHLNQIQNAQQLPLPHAIFRLAQMTTLLSTIQVIQQILQTSYAIHVSSASDLADKIKKLSISFTDIQSKCKKLKKELKNKTEIESKEYLKNNKDHTLFWTKLMQLFRYFSGKGIWIRVQLLKNPRFGSQQIQNHIETRWHTFGIVYMQYIRELAKIDRDLMRPYSILFEVSKRDCDHLLYLK